MIKRRVPTIDDQIDAFANSADSGSTSDMNPEAKRTYKSINVPFNQYEYSKLVAIAKKAKRSKLYMIREAIIKLADDT
jgi:hypothetical protein